MKYYSAIITLFSLSLFLLIPLLYFANVTRNIQKENISLKNQINFFEEQININEVEYNLHTNYNYLKKMQKIYLDHDNINTLNNIISFNDLKKTNLKNFHTVGIN